MKRIIRLTESDLTRIVKRVIIETKDDNHSKIEKLICKAMDKFVGEEDYVCNYKESSDKPYDRFVVILKNPTEDDTDDIAKEVIEYVHNKMERSILRIGNTSSRMFWLTYKK